MVFNTQLFSAFSWKYSHEYDSYEYNLQQHELHPRHNVPIYRKSSSSARRTNSTHCRAPANPSIRETVVRLADGDTETLYNIYRGPCATLFRRRCICCYNINDHIIMIRREGANDSGAGVSTGSRRAGGRRHGWLEGISLNF